ncbi:heme transporter FLVCR2 [Hydra vulgaris]|uniref:heme transporter FLVCR2 n=1 Tax=Hydra vulgaris TaxID=6087 RepID=UPI0032E9F020
MELSYQSGEMGIHGDIKVLVTSSSDSDLVIKTFTWRWLILALYSITAFSNTFVWLSLFTVPDIICAFYQIDKKVFFWSNNAFTLMQLFVAVPASLLPSKIGLRRTMILASSVNAIGAIILIGGAYRNGFPYFVTGQTIIAIGASILPQLAPEVSAVWFSEREQAISTSLGVILGNAGAAVCFLQPALLLKNVNLVTEMFFIDRKIKQLVYSQSAVCCCLFLLIMMFFKDRPKNPPSRSEAKRITADKLTIKVLKEQYKVLFKDKNYHLCGNSYALNSVIIIVTPGFLNEILSWKFQNQYIAIGWLGFGGILIGILGSIVFGIILDKTHAYKTISIFLATASLLFWIGFTESLAQYNSMVLTFTLFMISAFFFISFGPILVSLIAEMTYPISESSSYLFPITLGRFYSIPFVFYCGWLVAVKKVHAVCLSIAVLLATCLILIIFVKVEQKRKKADKILTITSTSET